MTLPQDFAGLSTEIGGSTLQFQRFTRSSIRALRLCSQPRPPPSLASALALRLFLAAGVPAQSRTSPSTSSVREWLARADRLRGRASRRVQGPHPRRPSESLAPAQSDPRPTRGRTARQDRRHRRDERKPGLHRRPHAGRRVVLARRVRDRADCGHHTNRRDDRRGDVAGPRRRAARVELPCRSPRRA